MRILQVNNFARFTGGADRHCLELTGLLREAGHEVAFVATEDPENVETRGEFVPASVTRASRDSIRLHGAAVAARALWNPNAAAATRRAIAALRPDLIHAHKLYPQLSVAPLVVARRLGIPIVQTIHDYDLIAASHVDHRGGRIDRHEGRLSYRALNTATFAVRRSIHRRAVDEWIAISSFVAGAYRRQGIESRLIENFVLPATQQPLGFDQRSGVVYLGWLSSEKGLDTLLDAADRLRQIPFVIVGGGPDAEAASRAASRLENVQFVGQVEPQHTAAFLGAARVCVMPARWEEPGGLTALEAMAHGTPVIASPRGGLGEYVGNAGNILADSLDALCRSCRLLCKDEAAWTERSAAGLAATRDVHSPERYLAELEAGYRHALHSSRPAGIRA